MADIPKLSLVNFRKNTYIFVEGQHSDGCFFIIREGSVKVFKQVRTSEDETGTVMGQGDFIGIVSAMSKRSQIETAKALTDVVLLSVNSSQFEGLIRYNSPVAMKMLQQFSRRVRSLNNTLTRLTTKSENTEKDTSILFHVGEYYNNLRMYSNAFYIFKRYTECYPEAEFTPRAKAYLTELEKFNKPCYETSNNFLRTYGKDGVVFAEGEIGSAFYVIQKGTVKITQILNGREIILAVLRHGDIFGEMAIIESKPRSATAIAQENDTVLMEILKGNFEQIAKNQPAIIKRLTFMLSERVWFSYKQLSNAKIADPLGRAYDYLAIVLEKNNIERRSAESFSFDFGPNELLKMAVIKSEDSNNVISQLLSDGNIAVSNGKLFANDVSDIFKLSAYHRKKIDKPPYQNKAKTVY
jgi:CRP-like cAMP-binding protein